MYYMRAILSMTKKKRRRRINLTVNSDIWDICQEKGQEYDLNWSEVAQRAFMAVLIKMEMLEDEINYEAASNPSLNSMIIESRLKSYINRDFLKIDANFIDPQEEEEAYTRMRIKQIEEEEALAEMKTNKEV